MGVKVLFVTRSESRVAHAAFRVPRSPNPQSAIRNPQFLVPPFVDRLLGTLMLFFLALAIAARPLMPGHRVEANLWIEMSVFIAAMAWLVRMAMARRLRLTRTGLGLPVLALLAIAAVSSLRSPHPMGSLATLLEWLSYAALLFVLANVVNEEGIDPRFFLRILWASAFAVVLYGLFQQFVNLPLLTKQIEADPGRVELELRMSARHLGDLMARAHGRIFSTFLVSNSFAGFLALVIPGFVGYLLDRLRAGDRGRLFLAASGLWLGGALACLLLTFSKGGWLAFGVGSFAFCVMLGKDLLRRHARIVAAAAAGAAAAVGLLFAVKVIPVQIFRDVVTSFDVRLGYWRGALAMARDHLFGGVGLGAYGLYFSRYRPLLAHPAQAAHNDYLQVLAELGIFGLAAFLWVWIAWLRNAFSSPRPSTLAPRPSLSSPRPSHRLAYLAAVAAFLLSSTVMATFTLAGWWDADPGSQELKVWLDRALAAGFLAGWVFFFAALGRGEAIPPGELCRKGLVCGMIAFFVHCALDFDYTEPGVAFTAWAVAALALAPRRAAFERRLSPVAAAALGAAAVLAMGAFQLILVRGSRASTDRDIAASLVSDSVRTPSPLRRAELLREARDRYESALKSNPLDDSLRVEYADLLVSLLIPPEADGMVRASDRPPRSSVLHVQIAPRDEGIFRRAVALYRRAAELDRAWAGPHIRLGRLFEAAADADARSALRPFIQSYSAPSHPAGTEPLYLPAVAELQAALEWDPNNPGLLVQFAEACEKYGALDVARRDVRRALDLQAALFAEHPAHKVLMSDAEAARAQALLKRLAP